MRKMSFMMRIGSMLVLFALVPTMLLMSLMIHVNRDSIYKQALSRANLEYSRLKDEITDLISGVEDMAATLSIDQTLVKSSKVLRRGATLGQEVDAYTDLSEMISLAKGKGTISDLLLYLPDGQLVTKQRRNIFGLSDLDESVLPTIMSTKPINSGWTAKGENLCFYYRVVYSPISNPIMVLMLAKNRINQLLDNFGIQSSVVLLAGDEELYRWGDQVGDVVGEEQSYGGMRMRIFIPSSQFMSSIRPVYTMGFGVLAVLLAAIPILAWSVSRPLNRTVGALAIANEAMTRHEYRCLPEDSSLQELYTLQVSHNRMVNAIQTMIRDVYEARHERDQAKLDILFEQIKPHFLYNTLEGGKWLALQENATRSAQFMERLAVFYRIGLSQGDDFVPLSMEIEHIKRYMDLMNMRYTDHISLVIEADEETQKVMILRLTLQPLVENSIEHGLHGQNSEGLIGISAQLKGDLLVIQVWDNGKGMPEVAVNLFNNEGMRGYGLSNVQRRLHTYYGVKGTLHLLSRPEGGLIVRITIPISNAPRSGD